MGRQGGMDARRPEKIECKSGLWKETIPFRKRKLRVNSAEDGNKVVFEGANGSFGSVGMVFFGRDTLEGDLVTAKSIFEVLGAFFVKNVKLDRMA
jgi:hypothetical protein